MVVPSMFENAVRNVAIEIFGVQPNLDAATYAAQARAERTPRQTTAPPALFVAVPIHVVQDDHVPARGDAHRLSANCIDDDVDTPCSQRRDLGRRRHS
jgi:hypothetical protein